MATPTQPPGRNDPCPCGSGRKYKQCCLASRGEEDSARMRIRRTEGRIVERLLEFILRTWGAPFVREAWEEFFVWGAVPEDMLGTQEFDPMFVPWLTTMFVPESTEYDDDEGREAERREASDAPWPTEPVATHWLATEAPKLDLFERQWIAAVCRSPMSAFVVEAVVPGRSVDLKDILTGRRFHVLEQSASQTFQRHDVTFSRVVSIGGTCVMFGTTPWVIRAEWHAPIIDFRERTRQGGLMTRADLEDWESEIRELYLDIVAKILNPVLPELQNTDADPLQLTILTFRVDDAVGDVAQRLASLARLPGDSASDDVLQDVEHDDAGVMTSAVVSWQKAGNKMHHEWTNTILGTLRITPGRLVAEVNSAKRAKACVREVTKLLGSGVELLSTEEIDPMMALAEGPPEAARPAPEVQAPELVAIEEEIFRKHLEAWVDQKVPALGNRTPRAVARDALGRERLAALISTFEHGQVERLPNGCAMLNDLRRRLGIEV